MTLLKKAMQLIGKESKRPWSEVNSWALALIGGSSFIVGSFYLWKVKEVAPDLIHVTEQVGFTSLGLAVYGIVGVMLVGAWHFLAIAKRCSELLRQRHYT